ncbi:21343_t:CDS:2, partial [Gigaspora rosea]
LKYLNNAPMSSDSLHAIYREIMSASTSLQGETSVAYFGSPGSYTHQAAREKFGDSVLYYPQTTINDVFDSVGKGDTTYGVVPFENSTFGSVVATFDRFISSKVQIFAEAYLKAFGQCQKWLDTHLKGVQRIDTFSTSKAAELSTVEPASAAISNSICADLYGLNILAKDIQDKKDNTTRFFILSTNSSRSTENDKTLLLFTVDHRKPGALCDSLRVFKDHNINLTKIDSRPSLQRPWHYVFFVELQGHKDDDVVKKSLEDLKEFCLDLKVLGSYQNQLQD